MRGVIRLPLLVLYLSVTIVNIFYYNKESKIYLKIASYRIRISAL